MYSGNPRTTAYSEFVFSNLPPTVESGGGLYNINELAQMVGLKPTGNFRRRVKQLVSMGKLKAHAVFTPRGGIEARYTIPAQNSTGDLPF